MFDQTICAVIGTCFRLAWTRLLTGDGQAGSNPKVRVADYTSKWIA